MKTYKFDKSWKNWLIGNFTPSVFKTNLFEVGVNEHPKDSSWPAHYHRKAIEITLVLDGKMKIGEQVFEKNDIFVIEPMEISKPIFLKNTRVLVVKIPSVIGDKYVVEDGLGNVRDVFNLSEKDLKIMEEIKEKILQELYNIDQPKGRIQLDLTDYYYNWYFNYKRRYMEHKLMNFFEEEYNISLSLDYMIDGSTYLVDFTRHLK